MRIGAFGLWIWATILVGGTFVFGQISHVPKDTPKIQATPSMKTIDPDSVAQNKWSVEEFQKIKQNPPFSLVLPNEQSLSKNELTGARITKDDSTNEVQVDFFYKTPNGLVHIWETNNNDEESYTLKPKAINIVNKKWNFQKDMNMFTTQINGVYVSVSGQVPEEQLINIISSLS